MPILDTHVHFYDTGRPGGVPWPPANDTLLYRPVLPPDFCTRTQPLGVTGAVVIEASPLPDDIQWLLDLARENPVIVGVVGKLMPGERDFAASLGRFSRNPLFRGIRLSASELRAGLGNPRFADDLRRLAESGRTLDLLGDGEMLPDVVRLAEKLPALTLVLDHLPWDSEKGSGTEALLAEAAEAPNVYAKVSGVARQEANGDTMVCPDFYRPLLDRVWAQFGPDRVLFGSNYPVCNRTAPYAVLLAIVQEYLADKAPETAAKFFHENAVAAYSVRAAINPT